jgi:hypothetical protein
LRDRLTQEAAGFSSEILQAISFSANPRDRIVAAYALGLVANGISDVSALVVAAHDVDPTVRNNAVRALGDLIDRNAEGADLIPTSIFIDLLVAPQWTDRNKGLYVLLGLAERRELALRRYPAAMASLKEMLDWPVEYAADARALLDRTLAPPS